MPLSKRLEELLTTDYTEVYRPPIKLPRNLTDEFNEILLSGDAVAVEKYYREVILPYCYSADLEENELKKWDRERAVRNGRKGGEIDREDIAKLHQEWRDTRDRMQRKNKGISLRQIAHAIEGDQEDCYYAHRRDPRQEYTFEHIRKVISKG